MITSTSINPCGFFRFTSGMSKGVRYALISVFSLLLVAGIWNGYRMCIYGLNLSDEPFHILNAMDYKNAPLTPLNSLAGHAFGSIFGWNYIYFRYLAWTFDALSILIAGCFLLWKVRDLVVTTGFTSALMIFESIARRLFSLYGWDCFAGLALTLMICLALVYFEKPSRKVLILLAVIGGLSVMIKITNIVFLPIFACFMCIRYRTYGQAILFSLIFVLSAVFVWMLIYGSISEYLQYLHQNSNPNHGSLPGLIKIQLLNVFYLLPYIGFYLLLYILINKFSYINIRYIILGTLILIFTNFLVLFGQCIMADNILLNFYVVVGISIVILVVIRNLFIGSFLIICGFITALGSDTALMKFLVIPITIFSVGYILYYYNFRSIIISSVILFVSFTAFKYFNHQRETFFDSGVPALTTSLSHPKLSGIRTSEPRRIYINDVLSNAMDRPTFVVADSLDKYLFEYIYENINPYTRQFFGKNRMKAFETQWYVDSISAHADRAPQGMQYLLLSTDTTTMMYKMLDEKMPAHRKSEYCTVFVKE